jgi:hypothetical protein
LRVWKRSFDWTEVPTPATVRELVAEYGRQHDSLTGRLCHRILGQEEAPALEAKTKSHGLSEDRWTIIRNSRSVRACHRYSHDCPVLNIAGFDTGVLYLVSQERRLERLTIES